MNASFEDVAVFDEVLEAHEGDWSKVFETFQDARVENANAIADLAIDNFTEMQDKVDDLDFIRKRKLEMQLEQTYPEYYSKYSLVTFRPDLAYAKAMALGRRQDELLLSLCAKYTPEELNLDEVMTQVRALQTEMSIED
jgi:kynurenine 3-monooxygenase